MPNEAIVPQQVPIELIHDLPDLPRVSLPDKAYGGLVTSILLDGIKSPLILRQAENGELQLVAGYRRRKAAELAKLKELPALVYEMTLKEAQKYHADANGPGQIPIPGKPVKWERKAQESKTAYGPTGTTITKLLGEKLEPPTDKDKKALPVPKEGETFSAVLHPAYLKRRISIPSPWIGTATISRSCINPLSASASGSR